MLRLRSLGLIFALFLLASCAPVDRDTDAGTADTVAPTPTTEPAEEVTGDPSWEEIVSQMGESTVLVRAQFPESAFPFENRGVGTGIVFSDHGHILTNAHVVVGATEISITLPGSTGERAARIVGSSTCENLAVLRVDDTSGLSPATLATVGRQSSGSEIAVLGFATGAAAGSDLSFSRGMISSSNEQFSFYTSLIRHDASMNPGYTGGPLVNRAGEVIGIGAWAVEPDQDAAGSYAIPIDGARSLANSLMDGQSPHWTGLNLQPNIYESEFEHNYGVIVAGVQPGSPADFIGVEPAQLVVQFGSFDVPDMAAACEYLRQTADDGRVLVTLSQYTDDEILLLEGTLVVGDASDGEAVEVVIRGARDTGEIVAEEVTDSDSGLIPLEPDEYDEILDSLLDYARQYLIPPDDEPSISEIAGVGFGTAVVEMNHWRQCPGEDWEMYVESTERVDAVIEFYQAGGGVGAELNEMVLFSEPERTEGGFYIETTNEFDPERVYWRIATDGNYFAAVLVDDSDFMESLGSVLYSHHWIDPCDAANPDFELRWVPLYPGAQIVGYVSAWSGYLEVFGHTSDGQREIFISIDFDYFTWEEWEEGFFD